MLLWTCRLWDIFLFSFANKFFLPASVLSSLWVVFMKLCRIMVYCYQKNRLYFGVDSSQSGLRPIYLPTPIYGDWRLRGNIIRIAPCWIGWHNVHSPQHTYMSTSYRSNRLGLSHWDPYAVRRGGYLELYCCNMVEWFWWDSSLISMTSWFPSVLWHCWFGHMAS